MRIEHTSNIDKDDIQDILRLVGNSSNENAGELLSAGSALTFYNKWQNGGEFAVARIAGRAQQTFDGGLQIDTADNTAAGQTNFNTVMWLGSNQNVGIGTTSPITKLEVNGDIGIGRVAGGYTFRETVGGGIRASMKSNASNELIFSYGGNVEAMRIKNDGNVGINTTTPLYKLDVNGTGRFSNNVQITGSLTLSKTSISNQEKLSMTGADGIASISSVDYKAMFVEYVVYSDTNQRIGTLMVSYNGSGVEFTEFGTVEQGDTNAFTFTVKQANNLIQLSGSVSSGTWNCKTMVRGI